MQPASHQSYSQWSFVYTILSNKTLTPVLHGPLQPNTRAGDASHPTGFYRDGYCWGSEDDDGKHFVAGVVTKEFLDFSKARGESPMWTERGCCGAAGLSCSLHSSALGACRNSGNGEHCKGTGREGLAHWRPDTHALVRWYCAAASPVPVTRPGNQNQKLAAI